MPHAHRFTPSLSLVRSLTVVLSLWFVLPLCALMSLTGCGGKEPAKTSSKAANSGSSLGSSPKNTGAQQASAVAPNTKSVAAKPGAPKPVAAKPGVGVGSAKKATAQLPAAATSTAREDSVALFFANKGSTDFALPTVGKATTVRATAISKSGRPIAALTDVVGSPLMLIAARTDLSWVKIMAPPKLDEAGRSTHHYTLTFPQAGPHILLFVFKPKDGARVMMPTFVNVRGKREPDQPPSGAQQTWKGRKGLRAKLLTPGLIDVCKPTALASTWRRRGKAVQLAPLTTSPSAHVAYVVLRPGLQDVQIIAPHASAASAASANLPAGTSAALAKLPKQTAAVFTPKTVGSTAILAITRIDGKPVIARFDVVVGGELPKGGCPK